MAAPTKPLKDAIAEYQKANPYSQQTFEALFPYLQKAGYNVARTTHANNTLASNDALVDNGGNVYDLVFNSDNAPGAGTPSWTNNPSGGYDPNRAVVGPDGKFIKYSEWATTTGGSTTPASGSSSSPTVATAGPQTVLGQGGMPWQVALSKVQAAVAKAKAGMGTGSGAPGSGGNPYEAAAAAAARARMTAKRGGRQSTILAGFGAGAPSTRPATVLGY